MWRLGDSFTHTVAHCWLIAFHAARTRVKSPGLAFSEGRRIRSLEGLGTGQVLCRAPYGHGAVREALLWASAAPALQEFSPFTSGIHLMVYLPSMIYL